MQCPGWSDLNLAAGRYFRISFHFSSGAERTNAYQALFTCVDSNDSQLAEMLLLQCNRMPTCPPANLLGTYWGSHIDDTTIVGTGFGRRREILMPIDLQSR